MSSKADITLPKFHAAYAKLGRAGRHIAELERVLAEHADANPLNHKRVPGVAAGSFNIPSPPDDTAVILGDIIHNALVSLDLMASELARINGKSDKGVYFPFAESKADLPKMIARKKFKRCGVNAVSLLETLAPYKGGNLPLRELHDLDIRDKHVALIPKPHMKMKVKLRELLKGNPPVEKINYVFPDDSLFKGQEIVSVSKSLVDLCESILKSFDAL